MGSPTNALEPFSCRGKRHIPAALVAVAVALMPASITAIELKENISDGLDKTQSL
jgi:hypothetical protein